MKDVREFFTKQAFWKILVDRLIKKQKQYFQIVDDAKQLGNLGANGWNGWNGNFKMGNSFFYPTAAKLFPTPTFRVRWDHTSVPEKEQIELAKGYKKGSGWPYVFYIGNLIITKEIDSNRVITKRDSQNRNPNRMCSLGAIEIEGGHVRYVPSTGKFVLRTATKIIFKWNDFAHRADHPEIVKTILCFPSVREEYHHMITPPIGGEVSLTYVASPRRWIDTKLFNAEEAEELKVLGINLYSTGEMHDREASDEMDFLFTTDVLQYKYERHS